MPFFSSSSRSMRSMKRRNCSAATLSDDIHFLHWIRIERRTLLASGVCLKHHQGWVISGGSLAGKLCSRSEEHTSELQSLMRISYAVFCLKKKTKHNLLD